jgi:protein SCO1/2
MIAAVVLAAMLHGVVLGVDPRAGTAVIKHDPFGGMPSMTMTFKVGPADARRLHAGDDVRGSVDTNVQPWRLQVTAVGTPSPRTDEGAQPPVPLLQPGDPVPDARFTDQLGRTRSWQDFRGHATVVSFIYTRCRDTAMCPLVSAKFGELQRILPPDARLIEFTLDPAYDTPAVLHRYGQEYGADPQRWTLATGDPETLREIAAAFGITIAAHTPTTIAHSEALGIVNGSGTVRQIVYGNAWQPDEVVATVREAEGSPSNPWQRFMFGLRQVARECGIGENALGHAAETLVFIGAMLVVVALVFVADFFVQRKRRKAGKGTG